MKSGNTLKVSTMQPLPVQFSVSFPHPNDIFWLSEPKGKGYSKQVKIPDDVSEVWVGVLYFESKDAVRAYRMTYEKLLAPFGLVVA
ncbi:hypothetical protein ACGFX8_35005 [Streptomyces sp. NPDC048362]|uniref:hypothetical protein n=1 Tax=Streptomyces sp. NPDC048362 TaxID=3365539 RepID=UPI00371B1F64